MHVDRSSDADQEYGIGGPSVSSSDGLKHVRNFVAIEVKT
jgi:hypothetical protein